MVDDAALVVCRPNQNGQLIEECLVCQTRNERHAAIIAGSHATGKLRETVNPRNELDSRICGRSPRRIISSAPGCPVLSRRSACRSPGVEVEVLAREQPAGPAESTCDFIGNEQRAVTPAEVAYPPDGVFSGISTPRLMLIGSMTKAATSCRFNRCSMRRSAVASNGGATLPFGSRFLICSRLSVAPMLNPPSVLPW